jgi:hypothetical protein
VGILDPTPCVTSFNTQTGTSTYGVTSGNSLAIITTSTQNATVTIDTALASSSITMLFGNATTTAPAYQVFELPASATIARVDCSEYASATTTFTGWYATSSANNTPALGTSIFSSFTCGKAVNSTTSITTTVPGGDYYFVVTTSTAGTPTLTTFSTVFTKL